VCNDWRDAKCNFITQQAKQNQKLIREIRAKQKYKAEEEEVIRPPALLLLIRRTRQS
jgi:hypothetical protein